MWKVELHAKVLLLKPTLLVGGADGCKKILLAVVSHNRVLGEVGLPALQKMVLQSPTVTQ